METSSVEDACCGGSRKQPPPAAALQRVGSGASDVIDPEVGVEAESGRKLPSSQYKGVVPQPNGRWGAQIYEKHQRVWLGTFNEEAEAARAYDVAVQRFRGRDAITNFRPLSDDDDDEAELAFLASRSKAEIVDMLRKHTYRDELMQSRRASGGDPKKTAGLASSARGAGPDAPPPDGVQRQQHLFDKTVTPSDVGKLNRLVIPKQHAEKYFPLQNTGAAAASKGLLLNFEDACGKMWRFRYSYWNSSQSYVLTKGWSRFVKEKGLVAGDVVTFRMSIGPEKQLFIDLKPRAGLGRVAAPAKPVKVFRLFGVDIVRVAPAAALNGRDGEQGSASASCGIRKRKKNAMALMASEEMIKKQCVEAL